MCSVVSMGIGTCQCTIPAVNSSCLFLMCADGLVQTGQNNIPFCSRSAVLNLSKHSTKRNLYLGPEALPEHDRSWFRTAVLLCRLPLCALAFNHTRWCSLALNSEQQGSAETTTANTQCLLPADFSVSSMRFCSFKIRQHSEFGWKGTMPPRLFHELALKSFRPD